MKDELFNFPHSALHYNPVILLSHLKLEDLNIENPKHLDMLYYDKKYRKDTYTLTYDIKRKNII